MRLYQQVEKLLRDYPQLRDSDMKLLISVWTAQGLKLSEQQIHVLMGCSNAESITRVRRKLRDKYPASEKVEEQRFNKFKQYRDDYSPAPNASIPTKRDWAEQESSMRLF